MIFLGLGSNIGDRENNIILAIKELKKNSAIIIERISSLYETEPFGVKEQPAFLNAVIGINTSLSPLDLLAECLRIENVLGRVREERWAPRIIDIDLLVYHDISMNSERLTIPHKFLAQRNFVLIPLAEIAGEYVVYQGNTVSQLLESSTDDCGVSFYKKLVL